jgi:predicted ATPase
VIASIHFRRFKALRAASLQLEPFNLVIGPNGSGKTSLIQAILQLRMLARRTLGGAPGAAQKPHGPELVFRFGPPHQAVEARLSCVSELVCDLLQVKTPSPEAWETVKGLIAGMRVYLFDHYAMAVPASRSSGTELTTNGGNLAAVLAMRRAQQPAAYAGLVAEAQRLMPEFSDIVIRDMPLDQVDLALTLREEGEVIPAENLSQGTLYTLALLALAYDPAPPTIVCIEEVDRGIHPRRLRDVRDLLYRLSYPSAFGLNRPPTQVIATTHSPYLLDQFRDHPEEIVIAQKSGRSATFERLIDRPDLDELLQEGSLGDMWYSGILGGVPEEGESLAPQPKRSKEGKP